MSRFAATALGTASPATWLRRGSPWLSPNGTRLQPGPLGFIPAGPVVIPNSAAVASADGPLGKFAAGSATSEGEAN
jgi:hypothetical protein